MNKVGMILTVTGALAAGNVFAQGTGTTAGGGNWGPQTGSQEITLSGTGASDNEFDNGTFGLAFSYGRYLNPNGELVLRQGVNLSDFGDDESWNGSTRIGYNHHFGTERARPFIGANIGMIYGDAVNNTGIISPEAGIKYYVKPETFLYGQIEYQVFFEEANDVNSNFDDGSWNYSVGLGYLY